MPLLRILVTKKGKNLGEMKVEEEGKEFSEIQTCGGFLSACISQQ